MPMKAKTGSSMAVGQTLPTASRAIKRERVGYARLTESVVLATHGLIIYLWSDMHEMSNNFLMMRNPNIIKPKQI